MRPAVCGELDGRIGILQIPLAQVAAADEAGFKLLSATRGIDCALHMRSVRQIKTRMASRRDGLDLRLPFAGFAALFFQHPHIGHHHAAVDRLAHVVNGQQSYLHCL